METFTRRCFFALAAGCCGVATIWMKSREPALVARFAIDGLGVALLEYEDHLNFRLTSPSFGSTWVANGRVFIVVPGSLASAGQSEVLWVGDSPDAASSSTTGRMHQLLVTTQPNDLIASWELPREVHDIKTFTGESRIERRLSVVKLPALSTAQWQVTRTLTEGMDMSYCGVLVNALLKLWPTDVTRHGYAVVGSHPGMKMIGKVEHLIVDFQLPRNLPVLDYRIRPAP